MSGIAGIIHFDGAPVEPALVKKMTSAMSYRGPDGINHWVKGSVAMGQCMLCTTSESLEENQPLTNEDESLVLVMDGRVDNWEELRKNLLGKGAVLRNRSDAELVLRSYEVWRENCLIHIDGDFALVIWDAEKKLTFCARDRVGNKPFHYNWDGKTLLFASDVHAIMTLPWITETLNEGMLAEFLATKWYSRDETFWKGMMRLVAAHQMSIDTTGLQIKQYWSPDLWATLSYKNDEDYIEHYRELLTDVVRKSSRSHKPVSYEVSGGLDSSAIFCVAEHLRRSDCLPAPAIEGYTLAFTGDNDANELIYARAVGNYLNIPIHEITPSVMPLSWYKERASIDREFPGFPNGSMFVDIRNKASQSGSRVILTGEWGDCWLEGSRAYYAEALGEKDWHSLSDCFRADASLFGSWQAMKWLARYGFFPMMPTALQESIRWIFQRMRGGSTRDAYWLSTRMREILDGRREQYKQQHNMNIRHHGQRSLLTMMYDPLNNHGMERLQRMCAHSGMEARHPLNDPSIIQFSLSMPERLRLHGDRTKYIHVQALKKIMPKLLLERKGKAEFSIVFHNHLYQMGEFFTKTLIRDRPDWIDSEGINRLYQYSQNDPHPEWSLWVLWSIYGCDTLQ